MQRISCHPFNDRIVGHFVAKLGEAALIVRSWLGGSGTPLLASM